MQGPEPRASDVEATEIGHSAAAPPDRPAPGPNFSGTFVQSAGDRAEAAALSAQREHAVPGYDVLGVLGEGGMGLVLLARDPRLGRNLAIKTIKLGHGQDRDARQRFLEEAHITAQLQHPGVPPVHELGTLADGRPFFAMKVVKGETLADLLQRRPGPGHDLGRFLKHFEQVCEAMAFAHEHGVIHRDLKPRNVMVGAFGELQVMDWGLAKVLVPGDGGPAPAAPASVSDSRTRIATPQRGDATRTHGAVGTYAYMAPEQAKGRVHLQDERCDVFSLGAILCEVLTGQPPYTAAAGPVQEQAEDAALGPALRRLDERPLDAELVGLAKRCLAPEREERPRNAKAVYEAIKAYRAGQERRQREAEQEALVAKAKAVEERKRRRVLAVLAATLLGMVVVALMGTAGVELQRRKTAAERDDKERARQAEQRARDRALAALRSLTDEVVENQMAGGPALTDESREFLRKTIEHFEGLADIIGGDADGRSIRAEGWARVGLMRFRLGELKEAEAAYADALALQRQLADEFPGRPEFRRDLATTLNRFGNLLNFTSRPKEAEAAYAEALRLRRALADELPDRPEVRQELATSYNNLGLLFSATGRPAQAEAAYADALAISRKLAAEFPKRREFRRELARNGHNFALVLRAAGKPAEAEAACGDALTAYKQLVADFPTRPEYRHELAGAHTLLGMLLRDAGRPGEAEAAYRDAVAQYRQLAADFPTRPEFRRNLAGGCHNVCLLLRDAGRPKEAEAACAEALALRQRLADDFPTRHELRHELAASHLCLANLLRDAGRLKDAEDTLNRALAVQKQLVADFPKRLDFRQDLAATHHDRGVLLADAGRSRDAEAAYGEAQTLYTGLVAEFPKQPDLHNALARTLTNLALLAVRGQSFSAAKARLDEARPHHEAALAANPRHPLYRQFYRNTLRVLARAHAGQLDPAAAFKIAETIRDLGWDPAADAYEAARALALCVPVVERVIERAADRKAATQSYADRALALLREAVARGFRDAARLKQDPDLAALRPRDDFKKLLADLEAKGQPAGKKTAAGK